MAGKKKGRKRSKSHAVAARTRTIVLANAPRHRRGRARRNPPFSVGMVVEKVKQGAIGAVAVVGGEAATRLIRSRAFGMPAGETMSSLTEVGIATAIGIGVGYGAAEKSMRAEFAADMMKGGYAGVLRATAKQLGAAHPIINEALGDGGPRNYVIRNGRVMAVSSAAGAGRARLNGYVPGAATPAVRIPAALGMYVGGSVNGSGSSTMS